MGDFQPPQQQANSLKRKASAELSSEQNRPAHAAEPYYVHGAHIATLYDQTYAETVTEIKKLLQKYALAASGCAPDNDSTMTGTEDYHNDIKNELQAILDDLASRPELMEMKEVRDVLRDCGIDIEARPNGAGGQFVNVQFRMA